MDRFTGVLVGTAVGDSLGLPREGMSASRAGAAYPGPLRQDLLFGRGMLSDDTEHACMTAQALLVAGDDPDRFARVLARKLRWWLAALPPAIGFGTLRALVRSWIGFSPRRSGVDSAGNGAVMRAPIIGVWCTDLDRLEILVGASTAITHRDPRAHAGALAIAIAAHLAHAPADVIPTIRARTRDRELLANLDAIERALAAGASPAEFAESIGCQTGITGYVHHTVAACLFVWLRAPLDPRAIADVIELGGDSDSTGAIVGALVGAAAGEGAMPRPWLRIVDAPRSLRWIRRLGDRLATRGPPLRLLWPIVPLRNLVFLAVVVVVAVRRLLPGARRTTSAA